MICYDFALLLACVSIHSQLLSDPLLDSTVHILCLYRYYNDWYLPRCHVGINKPRLFGADRRGEDRSHLKLASGQPRQTPPWYRTVLYGYRTITPWVLELLPKTAWSVESLGGLRAGRPSLLTQSMDYME